MSDVVMKADPILLEFLDLETYKEREDFLLKHGNEIDERTLDSMAMSLDLVLDGDNQLFDKKEQLLKCIRMQEKYECTRLR